MYRERLNLNQYKWNQFKKWFYDKTIGLFIINNISKNNKNCLLTNIKTKQFKTKSKQKKLNMKIIISNVIISLKIKDNYGN